MKLVQLSYMNEENVKVVENVNADSQRFIDIIARHVDDIRPCEPDEKEGLVGLVVERSYMDANRKTELLSVVISSEDGKLKFDLPETAIRGIRLKIYDDKKYGKLLGINLDLNRYYLNSKQKTNRILNTIKLVSEFNQQLISAWAVLNGNSKTNDGEDATKATTTPDTTAHISSETNNEELIVDGQPKNGRDNNEGGKEINFMP